MAESKIVACDCGYRVRARAEWRRAAEVRGHARDAHGMDLSAEEALAVVRRLAREADDAAPSGTAAVADTALGKETE